MCVFYTKQRISIKNEYLLKNSEYLLKTNFIYYIWIFFFYHVEDRIFAYVLVSVQLIFPFQEALGEIYTYILCTLSIVFFSLDGSYARESGKNNTE